MTNTDILTLLILGFLLWRGASRGFVRSIIGPLAMFLGSLASILDYQANHNIVQSLLIGLLGPIVLQIGLSMLLKFYNTFGDAGREPNILSRVLGALITSIWGVIFIALTVAFLLVVPPFMPFIQHLKDDAGRSGVGYLIKPAVTRLQEKLPAAQGLIPGLSGTNNAGPSPAMTGLMNNEKMKALLQDPEIQKAVEERNMSVLMTNPKIMALVQDKDLMKQMLAAMSQMPPQGQAPATEQTPEQTQTTP